MTPQPPTPDAASDERCEAFISYSHLDRDEALALKDGLRRRGVDLWMDESELHSGRWDEQLEQAIATSDTFVFVLSPASAASPECGRELSHAMHLGKRILPVPIRDTPIASLPDRLSSYQFIPSRGLFGEDADAALSQLVTEITTDREWVREHTEWSEKAREWEQHDRDASYLLSGAELETAERWRSDSAGKQPGLSALHNEYIDASRAGATKRLRRTRAATGGALVVAIALSVIALISRQAAVNSQHQASAGALAAQSVLQLGNDPQLSLLLADRAARTNETAAALDALRRALPANHLIRTLASSDVRPLSSAVWSPDGKRVLTMSQDGSARLFDAATGTVLHTFTAPGRGEAESGEGATFGASGHEILTWGYGAARVWNAATGTLITTIAAPTLSFQFAMAVLSPDGSTVATASGPGASGSDVLWSAVTGARLHTLAQSTQPDAGEDIAFSPNSQLVAVGGNGGTAAVWQVSTGRFVRRLDVTRGSVAASSPLLGISSVAFSPDSALLATGAGLPPTFVTEGEQSESAIFDIASGGRVGASLAGNEPSWSPGGRYVVTTSPDGTANVWQVNRGSDVAQMKTSYGITEQALFGPDVYNPQTKVRDIAHVVTGSATGKATVWDALNGTEISQLAGDSGTVTPAGFSPDGSRVLTYSSDGEARIWGDGVIAPAPAPVPAPIKAAEAADGSVVDTGFDRPLDPLLPVVAIGLTDKGVPSVGPPGSLVVLNARSGRRLARMPADPTDHVAFDTRGRVMLQMRTVYSSGQGTNLPAQIRRTAGGGLMHTLSGPAGRATAGAVSPDGTLAATVDVRDEIAVWDVRSGRRLVLFRGHAGRRTQFGNVDVVLTFSPDGRFVASSDDGGLTEVWRARTGQVVNAIQGPAAPAGMHGDWGATVSPDGRYVATFAGWDTNGHVYPVGRAREVLSLPAGASGINGLAFNQDGSLIATISTGGVQLWDIREPSAIESIPGNFGTGIAFSPDGLTLEINDFDTGTSTLPCAICGGFPRLLSEAKKLEARGFTPEERALYLGG